MNRRWLYLLALGYLLLAALVWTAADPVARPERLLGFSATYLLTWTLIVVWRFGEQISAQLASLQRSVLTVRAEEEEKAAEAEKTKETREKEKEATREEEPTEEDDMATLVVEPPAETTPPGELPRLMQSALADAARSLASFNATRRRNAGLVADPADETPATDAGTEGDALVERVVRVIGTPDSTDACVKRISPDRVRIVISALIPSEGAKRSVARDRQRFRQQLDERLASLGWHPPAGAAVYTYERDATRS